MSIRNSCTDGERVYRKFPPHGQALHLPSQANGLEEIIIPLSCEESLHRAMLSQASEDALMYAATTAFRDYLGLLSINGVEGAILDISNGYFCTGYSDPSILPIFAFNADAADASYSQLAWKHAYDRADWGMAETGKNSFSLRLFRFLNKLDEATAEDRALIATPYAPTDVYDKVAAAADIIKHAAAANYFQRLAALVDASYMPHPLRSPFVLFEQVYAESPDVALRQRVVALAEAIHTGRLDKLNDRFGLALGDVTVPFVLAATLRAAASPAEVLQRALEMRESKAAGRLRGWFTTLHEELASEHVDRASIERRLEELERLLHRSLDSAPPVPDRGGGRTISLGVNIGLVCIATDLDVRKAIRLMSPTKRQLRFLHDLTRVAKATPRLSPSLKRVFGNSTAEAWHRSRATMVNFVAPPKSNEHRSILDIR